MVFCRMMGCAVGALVLAASTAPAAAQNSFGEAQGGGFGQAPAGQRSGFQQPPNFQQQPGFGQQPGLERQPGVGRQPGAYQQPQPGYRQPPSSGVGAQQPRPQPNAGGPNPQLAQFLDQLAQYERQDLGVPATRTLHSGAMHGNTPASIPGGQLITTRDLVALIQGQRTPYLLIHVLGSGEMMPGAVAAVQASAAGSFNDPISQQMGAYLRQATQGQKQAALIFYCASRECWMSYNAALRAINLGYTNVLWYRGGLQAWKQAGGPTVRAGGYDGGAGGQYQPGGPQQPGAHHGGGYRRN